MHSIPRTRKKYDVECLLVNDEIVNREVVARHSEEAEEEIFAGYSDVAAVLSMTISPNQEFDK